MSTFFVNFKIRQNKEASVSYLSMSQTKIELPYLCIIIFSNHMNSTVNKIVLFIITYEHHTFFFASKRTSSRLSDHL